MGHEAPLPDLESRYFRLLLRGSCVVLVKSALSCFYTGQGRTVVVMIVDAFGCYANFALDCWLIFDPPAPLPGGVEGAAIASVLSAAIGIAMYGALIFRRRYEKEFRALSGWRPDFALLRRLLRFGLPSGIHGLVDMLAFSAFILVVGVFGFQAQFATNVAMNINFLLFFPAIGLHHATLVLAGQFAGARDSRRSEVMTTGALAITLAYMSVTCILYAYFPDFFIVWFRGSIPAHEWAPILDLSRLLLLVVAFYSMFDAISLTLSGTLKGAGDTKFVMFMSIFISQTLLGVPCLLIAAQRSRFTPMQGMAAAWAFVAVYILVISLAFYLRYRAGRWKTMQVIEGEAAAPALPPHGVAEAAEGTTPA